MSLIIVESPTKARTLGRFLGKNYRVIASMGHIRDLPKKKLGVDTKNNYKVSYVQMPGKKKIISELREAGDKAKEIILATDPDREGEAIAYHVAKILSSKNKKIIRIVFHEITSEAVKRALADPGDIKLNLVHAQQARRVLDRLVGYKLSPLLWRKVRRGLSAGRVQSVTVRLIVEREKEIKAFKSEDYWEFYAKLYNSKPSQVFTAKLLKIDNKKAEVKNKKAADKTKLELEKSKYTISDIRSKDLSTYPMPPFITSTLQRSAANLFRFSAKRTMSIAQRLYEAGLITYHRTDSLSLSSQALQMLRSYIKKEYGKKYLPQKPNFYKTKSRSAQEAHESIRPTKLVHKRELKADELKLFELIKKRALSSQMTPALYQRQTIDILADTKYLFRKNSQKLLFDGYLKVWGKSNGEEDPEAIHLKDLKKEDQVQLKKLDILAKQTQPPARFSEASLIKALEEKGIGRPSTYAPIISTIQLRSYVEKVEAYFQPTPVGTTVTEFLEKYFPKIMDYEFTAGMEDDLDLIAEGDKKWQVVLDDFYKPFAKTLDQVAKKSKRVEIPTEKTGEKCPECKKGDQVIRVGRFGKFLSCSNFPDCKWKNVYKQVIKGVVCPDCGGEILIRQTRNRKKFFGCAKWPKCKWASWRKPKPPVSKGSDPT